MRLSTPRRRGAVVIAGLLLVLLTAPPAAAQKVPITFDDFHGYTGTVDYLRQVARAYPDITELTEIGRTAMGRSIYVLAISTMKTGTTIDRLVPLRNERREGVKNVTPMKPYQGKPGQWIDGGTHGNEYTGTEVCLYIIDKLVTGYGTDPGIKALVDANVFYICPMVNPDGVYNSVEKDISQRQNSDLVDDDGDGKVNEDGPDDLNGDGHITQFRYPDPEGRYYIDSEDPRLMVRISGETPAGITRYSVVREDKDNDGDGRIGEDAERGIDVNRNYPEGWFTDEMGQGGSGYYAASAPESHAILEFFTNHTNILLVQSFHTSGGFTYRPFARWPDSRIAPQDLVIYDRVMGKKYLEILGVEVPAAWQDAPAAPARQSGMQRTQAGQPAARSGGQQARGASASMQMPREWRPPYNAAQGRPYGYGIFIDWAYAQFGAWSMTTELWNPSRDFPGMPAFEGDDARVQQERWLLAYQDEQFGGKFFLPWKKFRHPTLGEGEVGGWIPKYTGGNAFPGDALRHVADTHWQFELWKAQQLPKVSITDVRGEVVGTAGNNRIVKVTATVSNDGPLGTHLARGAALDGNRQDVVWLLGDRDRIQFLEGSAFQSIGTLAGTLSGEEERGAAGGAAAARQRNGMPPVGMQQFQGQRGGASQAASGSGNTRTLTWLVSLSGNVPLRVVFSSQKGGTVLADVPIR